ncbi:MAG: hypothetical protein IV094_06085 [Vitreoscilla sp.]|nr:hypothetical protein [Vitreoscilla sp.]
MTLLLACVLSALHDPKPDWFAATDSLAMRAVVAVDDGLGHPLQAPRWLQDWSPTAAGMIEGLVLRRSTLHQQLIDAPVNEWTVVTLTPEAHAQFLQRGTPVPRARLACVIDRMAARLSQARNGLLSDPDLKRDWRPTVAIDIDVTTVEARAGRQSTADEHWKRQIDERDCLRDTTECNPADLRTEDGVMRCALRRLAKNAHVVAVVYPRSSAESRRLRNEFIYRTCVCTGPSCPVRPPKADKDEEMQAQKDLVVTYASAQLLFAPQDTIFEFASRRKQLNEPGVSQADPVGLPDRFPGLGQVAAATHLVHAPGRNVPEKAKPDRLNDHYCAQLLKHGPTTVLIDDELQAPSPARHIPSLYQFDPIDLGAVRSHVGNFDLTPTTKQSLAAELDNSFGGLPITDLYVLSVDSGTTEDKFVVPVPPTSVSGAWVHAAVGATLIRKLDEGHDRPGTYLHHVRTELAFGAILLMLVVPVGRWPRQDRYPMWHATVTMVLPLVASGALLFAYFVKTAVDFGHGHWTNPLLMLVGLTLHIYLDAASRSAHAAHAPGSSSAVAPAWFDRWWVVAVQAGWAVALFGSVYQGTRHEAHPLDGASMAGILLAGVLYAVIARQVRWLPLPARH